MIGDQSQGSLSHANRIERTCCSAVLTEKSEILNLHVSDICTARSALHLLPSEVPRETHREKGNLCAC